MQQSWEPLPPEQHTVAAAASKPAIQQQHQQYQEHDVHLDTLLVTGSATLDSPAAAAAPPCTPAAAAAAAGNGSHTQPLPRVMFHDDTSLGILSIPSPNQATVQAEDADADRNRLLDSCPAVPRGLPHGPAMWAGSIGGFEAASSCGADPVVRGASSSNGVIAAGAVADGLTGILALVKQLQGNLAGLESDMQQLHGVLHRPAGSNAAGGSSSSSDSSVMGLRRGSARSELLSECDHASVVTVSQNASVALSAAGSMRSRSGNLGLHSSRCGEITGELAAIWKVSAAAEGCSNSSEPVTPLTPPLAAAGMAGDCAANACAAAAAAAAVFKPSWVRGSSGGGSGDGVGCTAADVEAWVGSQLTDADSADADSADADVDAMVLQQQGRISISMGGTSLAAAVSGGDGAVASHCIEHFDTDEGSSVAEDGEVEGV
jgi:hypothetical protein